MAAFKKLKDVCQDFEQELRQVSNELFSAKLEETFEDVVSKRTRDLSLFTAKYKFFRASPLSLQPPIKDLELEEQATLSTYEDAVVQSLMEKYFVKATTQAQAVKALVTTSDATLDAELLARKIKILRILQECSHLEHMILTASKILKEKEHSLLELRTRWQGQVSALRAIKEEASPLHEINTEGKYYEALSNYIQKIDQMRWMITKLTTPRTIGYDWQNDPYKRLQALKAARKNVGVDSFVSDIA